MFDAFGEIDQHFPYKYTLLPSIILTRWIDPFSIFQRPSSLKMSNCPEETKAWLEWHKCCQIIQTFLITLVLYLHTATKSNTMSQFIEDDGRKKDQPSGA